MDNYQAVYEAVRSRIGEFNGERLIQEIVSKFDISYQVESIKNEFINVAYEQQRPSVLFSPKLSIVGDQYRALFGDGIEEGVVAFGKTPDEAMRNFDKSWEKQLTKKK